MSSPAVVVFEKQPRWVPELQRQYESENIRVRGCRSIGDVVARLHESPVSMALLDLDAGPAECLQLLGRLIRENGAPPTVVIGSRRSADLEWAVRELGAADFVDRFIGGETLAKACRRQLTLAAADKADASRGLD